MCELRESKNSINVLLLIVIIIFAISCGQPKSNVDINKLPSLTAEVEVLSLVNVPNKTEEYELTFGSKEDKTLKLAMLVGKYEAQELAVTIENMKPTAPLPLDVLQEVIIKLGYTVKEAFIDSLINEVYTAKIICKKDSGLIKFRVRPVDATTIALKFNAPIFVNSNFLTR
ncbi:MAG: bifunctional nuclease domain-containing protein [Bacteroidota bacterium]